MKKVLAISSVMLGVVFLAGCGQQPVSQTQPTTPAPVAQQPTPTQPTPTTPDSSATQTYQNDKYGFEFMYPKNLKVAEMGIQQAENPSYKFESFNISSTNESEGFIMHIEVSTDPKIVDLPNENSLKDKTINGINFKAFSQLGMGDRSGYMVKHGQNYFLLDSVFDSGQFDQILSTFKFTK